MIISAPAMAHKPNAQPGSCPCPSSTAAMSPTPAPLDTPSNPGSASGFSKRACITAPDKANAAPTSKTARVRGNRICQTNRSPRALNQSPGAIHCSPAHKLITSMTNSNSDKVPNQYRSRRRCNCAKGCMFILFLWVISLILR